MYRLLPALALLLMSGFSHGALYKCKNEKGEVIFSDTACKGERETLRKSKHPSKAAIDDRAVQGCLAHLRRTQPFADPDSVKVEGHSFKWVTVKDVGARRMLTLMVNSKNEYGAYAGARPVQCLMMGDGQTVNSRPYELLE